MSLNRLPKELRRELKKRLSLTRLSKTGFFRKAEVPHPDIEGELLLYRFILDKALIDSFSPREEIREDVELWLDLNNEDFITICTLAMLDPKGVYATFKVYKNLLRGDNARFKGFGSKH